MKVKIEKTRISNWYTGITQRDVSGREEEGRFRMGNMCIPVADSHWCMEKAMAPHSSTLAWKILWTEKPGRLQSMWLQRVGHDWATSFTFHFHALEKEMATHFSVLAWRIPGMAEPGGLPSLGLHRVGHHWRDVAAAWQNQYNIVK